jgi:AraC family transcriptional regulator of adaptative response / DNA-3-methyladenine glycosylase II
MHLDAKRCYEALRSRDRRFDGRFFTGVTTTGIYCRPVCPARTPHARNVVFFAHAAAAEEAGFRPCRRCRPELAPGSPEWDRTPELIVRALRLIDEGALDEGGDVQTLAARLHVSDRQLRRLFIEHVGATPASVARSRRAHFARRLLDQTALPVSEIAFASGFGSLRACNETMRAIFQRTPTELRGRAASGAITLKLAFRPPLAWDVALEWLGHRVTAGVEAVTDGSYERTTPAGVVSVASGDDHLLVTAPSTDGLLQIASRVRRMFDLDADPTAIRAHLGRDALLRTRGDHRLPGAWDPFESAVRVILGQQISVRAATTLAGRLVAAYGKPIDAPVGDLTHLHPSPETLADADLRGIGATGSQQRAVNALAGAIADGSLSLDAPLGLDDLVERLVSLPGVGPWSAHTIAMRCGEPDAFPAGDLGLLKASGLGERELRSRADAWRPWRSYAAVMLWRSL